MLGQPLYQADGNWKDHSFSNFSKDYDRLLGIIEASLRGHNDEGRPHDIVILSGDIHTGRYTWASLGDPKLRPVHEFIASPSSRIGPFTSDPSPCRAPGKVRPEKPISNRVPWKVHRPDDPPFEILHNNVGVVRMFRSQRRPYQLRVELVSYMVRPYRRASWKIFARSEKVDYQDKRQLRLNPKPIEIYLQ